MTRVVILTFFGEKRWHDGTDAPAPHPHESPSVMTAPMVLIAIGSVASGFFLAFGGALEHWLEPVVAAGSEASGAGVTGEDHAELGIPVWAMTVIILVVVAVGVGIAYWQYATRAVPEIAPDDVSALTVAARRDLYGDAANEALLMRPGQHVTAGLVEVENSGVDGLTSGVGAGIAGLSERIRGWQSGYVRSYALSMFAGAAVITALVMVVNVL
jgi:NADH-quinone oxidoreductase subunit L